MLGPCPMPTTPTLAPNGPNEMTSTCTLSPGRKVVIDESPEEEVERKRQFDCEPNLRRGKPEKRVQRLQCETRALAKRGGSLLELLEARCGQTNVAAVETVSKEQAL